MVGRYIDLARSSESKKDGATMDDGVAGEPAGAVASADRLDEAPSSLAAAGPHRLPLPDVPLKRWLTFTGDVGRFLDSPFCAVAVALGWGAYDLFGCDRDRPFARIDRAGLLWLLNGDRVIALTTETAVIEKHTSTRQTWHRKPTEATQVLAWELLR
jgi:hypothetical protein